jgi:hypothetical protein
MVKDIKWSISSWEEYSYQPSPCPSRLNARFYATSFFFANKSIFQIVVLGQSRTRDACRLELKISTEDLNLDGSSLVIISPKLWRQP